jgi:quercetin dioxygenase-like cupin family protein
MSDPVLGRFDLAAEIARLAPGDAESGRRAETLIKTDRFRVVLIVMRSGAQLHEHTAPGPISIQALRGEFAVAVGDDESTLAAGGLVSLAPGVEHAVRALSDGAFLLTMAWDPDWRGAPGGPPPEPQAGDS